MSSLTTMYDELKFPMEDSTTMNYVHEYDPMMLSIEDLMFDDPMASIHRDCEKIQDDFCLGDSFSLGEQDLKPEIRNADLMWSATAGCNNGATCHSSHGNNSAASSYSESSAMALAVVSGSTNPYSTYQRQQSQSQQAQTQLQLEQDIIDAIPVTIKKEQVDMDYVFAEKRRRLSGGEKKSQSQSEAQNEDQLIPPGGSLLRKRNPLAQPSLAFIRKVTGEFKNRKVVQRPDTPHSLTDEVAAPEFRHNVDLRACVMGSNNISLTSDVDINSITQISGYLQNGTKGAPFAARFPMNDMNDVLDVLNQEVSQSQTQQTQQTQQQQQAIDKVVTSSTVASPPTTSSDCDSDEGDSINYARMMREMRRNQSSKIINSGFAMMLHSDHSYTRCNEMVDDGPHIETPSDSDEEIDVVTYTDKKLPNNPSCQIMGALQTQMAQKISVDQKKPRYGNYNLPYTPASSSPVKSVANSRYPSPSSTPYQNCSSASQSYSPLSVDSSSSSSSSSSSTSSITSGLVATTATAATSSQKGRKHYYLTVASSRRIVHAASSAMLSKKCRGKKAAAAAAAAAAVANISSSSSTSSSSSSGTGSPVVQGSVAGHNWQRQSSSTSSASAGLNNGRNGGGANSGGNQFSLDEADTIEKRNQHNDMERQRRIGLKNLFEALKKQIPNIRDKERAPKVNILREAAKLCEQLTREEQELSLQRQMLKEKLKQQQELLARFRLVKSEPIPANSG